MDKRKITNLKNLKFKPFNKYGEPIHGWQWHNISFDKKTNFGTYISKLEPGTKTIKHTHEGYEEFLILDGELILVYQLYRRQQIHYLKQKDF